MRSFRIVVLSPVFNNNACFAQIQEPFSIQAFIAEATVETFDVAVLPRTTWIDIYSLDLIFSEPVLDFLGDKFRSIIASDVLGDSIGGHRLPQPSEDLLGSNLTLDADSRTLTVYSSSMVNIFSVLPLSVRSKIKSQVHT